MPLRRNCESGYSVRSKAKPQRSFARCDPDRRKAAYELYLAILDRLGAGRGCASATGGRTVPCVRSPAECEGGRRVCRPSRDGAGQRQSGRRGFHRPAHGQALVPGPNSIHLRPAGAARHTVHAGGRPGGLLSPGTGRAPDIWLSAPFHFGLHFSGHASTGDAGVILCGQELVVHGTNLDATRAAIRRHWRRQCSNGHEVEWSYCSAVNDGLAAV